MLHRIPVSLALVALLAPVARASTFLVTTTTDGAPGSLREALALANAAPGPDTILLPAGLYELPLGRLVITDPLGLAIEGQGARQTRVDALLATPAFQVEPAATATLRALEIANGQSTETFEGGNCNVEGHLTLEDCSVTSGRATFGGGVRVTSASASLVVRRCAFTDNVGYGSAIESQQGSVLVSDSTISGNVGNGGALRLSNGSLLDVRNSTVVANGSGLVLAGGLAQGRITSSIVSANAGGDTSETGFGWGVWTDGGHNLLGETNGSVFAAPTTRIGLDPRLLPLDWNGGPTRTHALRLTSPALDAGANPDGLTHDQRGQPRVRGASTDIGAFERSRALPEVGGPLPAGG